MKTSSQHLRCGRNFKADDRPRNKACLEIDNEGRVIVISLGEKGVHRNQYHFFGCGESDVRTGDFLVSVRNRSQQSVRCDVPWLTLLIHRQKKLVVLDKPCHL